MFIWSLTGHSMGGGALLAVVHDHTVMRTDRGWFSIPEVKLNLSFTAQIYKLIRLVNCNEVIVCLHFFVEF